MPNRAPIAPALFRRKGSAHADPFYGYGYNPAWPSILSVAHDEEDGGSLFIILDRPCVLAGLTLPLIVPESGTPLTIVAAEMVLPVKLRVTLSDAVPLHAAWRWSGGSCSLYDPITGNFPNAGAGDCADFPGPYTPPVPATVIAATATGFGGTLQFDRPITLLSTAPDDAVLFDGIAPMAVANYAPDTLGFECSNFLAPGASWQIVRQPAWVATIVAQPVDGTFA